MSNLESSVVLMKEYQENNQVTATKEKEEKKNKSTNMPPFAISMISYNQPQTADQQLQASTQNLS